MASFLSNVSASYLASKDGKYRLLSRNGYTQEDTRFVHLHDAVETALSNILRYGYDIDREEAVPSTAKKIKQQIETWAIHMAQEIPGYNDWDGIYRFTWDLLQMRDMVPGEDTTSIGTERDLHDDDAHFTQSMRSAYDLGDRAEERQQLDDYDAALETARRRQGILEQIRGRYCAENPMPQPLALLFRKVFYAYKLRECLIGQTGYYNGSLQLAAGLEKDFEYNMYLIQMKLRRPDRLFDFKAPKQMAFYRTGPSSETPWNSQFSASYGFDEFGPGQIPPLGVNYIERRLVEVIRADVNETKWKELCALLDWDQSTRPATDERDRMKTGFVPVQQGGTETYVLPRHLTLTDCGFHQLTLSNIVRLLHGNEVKLKAFFTLFLTLTWSDTNLRREDNTFAQIYDRRAGQQLRTGAPIEHALGHLRPEDVKDPRIADPDLPALLSLKDAARFAQVVGRKANFILDPESTAADYRSKLERLSDDQLNRLFGNVPAFPNDALRGDKIDAVVHQSVAQFKAWATSAVENRRPVYTGPSSHVITYAEIALSSPEKNCENKANHPNLEQIRLTLLAALIGSNQHHTYDECMFTSHGLSHKGSTLEYKDRKGFRDITQSNDPFVRQVGVLLIHAAAKIVHQAIANFEALAPALDPPMASWNRTGEAWFSTAFGRELPKPRA